MHRRDWAKTKITCEILIAIFQGFWKVIFPLWTSFNTCEAQVKNLAVFSGDKKMFFVLQIQTSNLDLWLPRHLGGWLLGVHYHLDSSLLTWNCLVMGSEYSVIVYLNYPFLIPSNPDAKPWSGISTSWIPTLSSCLCLLSCTPCSCQISMRTYRHILFLILFQVVALIANETLIVANAGDSRCVASRNGVAHAMTHDHKPTDDLEAARIHNVSFSISFLDLFCGRGPSLTQEIFLPVPVYTWVYWNCFSESLLYNRASLEGTRHMQQKFKLYKLLYQTNTCSS